MRSALNLLLALVLAAVLAVNWAIHPDPSVRNVEVMAEMVNSEAYETQAENTAVAGGNTSLGPLPGTIARGLLPLAYGPGAADAQRAGAELVNPLSADDRAALSRGAVVYGNFCAACHGPLGLGDGPVTMRGVPPPPSLLEESAMAMADGQLFHIITHGQKNMPSHAAQVGREDRWHVILHVRDMQKKHVAANGDAAAPTPSEQEVQ